MKLKIILFSIASILFSKSQAQVSKEMFDKSVDLLNCKTVELTLAKVNIQNYQQQCPCNNASFTEINKFLTSVGKLDATIALSNEVESLKKSFKPNWKTEEVISFLSENIFTDKKYQKIVAFSDRRKGKPEFDSYKSNLKSELIKNLSENIHYEDNNKGLNNIIETTIEERVSVIEKNQTNKEEDTSILGKFSDYLILFSILLGVIAVILSLRKTKQDGHEISNEIKKYINKKIEETNWNKNQLGNQISSLELKENNDKIKGLELQIKSLNEKFTTSAFSSPNTQPMNAETKQPEVRIETFFLSSPNSDGSFEDSSASPTYKEGATIYRFIKTGNNKANFQIDEKEASIKLALQYRDKRIDPVCEATNAFNQAKHISTVQKGEADLQNGKWIVNKKAKIKYEN